MGKFVDLTGEVFGRLTVVRISENKTKDNKYKYWCRCSCGNTEEVEKLAVNLRSGDTKSCGCLQRENAIRLSKSKAGGGSQFHNIFKGTYRCWVNMKARCDDVGHQSYHNYGGRGITYTEKWATFKGFLEDMGERPKGLSLNRIDVNGGYCKDNCEWASSLKQGRDRRKHSTPTTSKYKGVSFCKGMGKYKGYLTYKGINHHLGYSDSPEELAEKYDKLTLTLTGSVTGTNRFLGLL